MADAYADKSASGESREAIRLLLVHIPKTAGISLFRALENWAGSGRSLRFAFGGVSDAVAFRELSAERLANLRLIGGHLSLATFSERLGNEWRAITVLRDPVERFLSLYSYVKRSADHPWYADVRDLSPSAFFDWQGSDATEANRQCRMVCGVANPEIAWRALMERYYFAATVEHVPELGAALSGVLGVHLRIGRDNATANRRRVDEVDDDIIQALRGRDAADFVLYERLRAAVLVGNGVAGASRADRR